MFNKFFATQPVTATTSQTSVLLSAAVSPPVTAGASQLTHPACHSGRYHQHHSALPDQPTSPSPASMTQTMQNLASPSSVWSGERISITSTPVHSQFRGSPVSSRRNSFLATTRSGTMDLPPKVHRSSRQRFIERRCCINYSHQTWLQPAILPLGHRL